MFPHFTDLTQSTQKISNKVFCFLYATFRKNRTKVFDETRLIAQYHLTSLVTTSTQRNGNKCLYLKRNKGKLITSVHAGFLERFVLRFGLRSPACAVITAEISHRLVR